MTLRSPLIAASGTVGSVFDFTGVAELGPYGAAVAKSVSRDPWPGRPPPRLAPAGPGMLNAIGIQNPGIDHWSAEVAPHLPALGVPLWGSAVGTDPAEFAQVAAGLERAGVAAIEVNLSCPNLAGEMFSLVPAAAAEVISAVRAASSLSVGAKLSPNAVDIAAVAGACLDAGADFLTLTNTIWGAAVDLWSRRSLLGSASGGYSGPPLKPISLRCVIEVHRQFPEAAIVGCGGVSTGADVIDYLLAGATAVALGTVHFAEPKAGRRIRRELIKLLGRIGAASTSELVGQLKLS
jgi:dihydroorotate dehydrogenase (NAD+) catalytic subunit